MYYSLNVYEIAKAKNIEKALSNIGVNPKKIKMIVQY